MLRKIQAIRKRHAQSFEGGDTNQTRHRWWDSWVISCKARSSDNHLARLSHIELEIIVRSPSQYGIEFKLDGIKSIFTWVVGLFAAIFVGGAGAFWKIIAHNRQINNKLDAAVSIASERDVRHTNRERDIQLGQRNERV